MLRVQGCWSSGKGYRSSHRHCLSLQDSRDAERRVWWARGMDNLITCGHVSGFVEDRADNRTLLDLVEESASLMTARGNKLNKMGKNHEVVVTTW